MQPNGNLVLESNNGNIIWQTNTVVASDSSSRYKLELEDSGSISIINAMGTTIWSSASPFSSTSTSTAGSSNLKGKLFKFKLFFLELILILLLVQAWNQL